MAKVGNNILTKGLTGMIGKQMVFRNLYGETIVSYRPVRTKAPSQAQIDNQQAFAARQIWARAQQTNPLYVAASDANKAKFPGGFHAAMHDAAIPPALKVGRHFRDGALVFGAGQSVSPAGDTDYIVEVFPAGLSLASVSAQIGVVTEQPSAQAADHVFTLEHPFEDVPAANIAKLPSPDGSGNENWQIDLLAAVNYHITNTAWSPTADNFVVLTYTGVDNYGNTVVINPTDMNSEALTTFGEAIIYLESKLAS